MPETLTDLSNALAAVVERHAPSVVRIEARRRGPSSGVVWSADGVLVTAHHVIEHDEGIPQGRSAQVAGRSGPLGRQRNELFGHLAAQAQTSAQQQQGREDAGVFDISWHDAPLHGL